MSFWQTNLGPPYGCPTAVSSFIWKANLGQPYGCPTVGPTHVWQAKPVQPHGCCMSRPGPIWNTNLGQPHGCPTVGWTQVWQAKPVQPHGCPTAGCAHVIWADSRWYSGRSSSGLTPDDTVEVCLVGQFKPARWVPVILAGTRVAGMAWLVKHVITQPGGSQSYWPAPVWLGWLGVPIIEGPRARGQSDTRNQSEKCPENPEVEAGGYSLVCHFAGPGSAGLGINRLDRNRDIGGARLRWAGF